VREPLGARPRIGETLWKTALAALAACAIGWAMCALAGRVLGEPGGTMTRALRLGPVLAWWGWFISPWPVGCASPTWTAPKRCC